MEGEKGKGISGKKENSEELIVMRSLLEIELNIKGSWKVEIKSIKSSK